jgi:hypothetical protein
MTRRAPHAAAFAAVAALALLGGCRATLVPPDGSDPARVQVQQLERKVAALESRNAELETQVATLRGAGQGVGAAPADDIVLATPRLASVGLGGTGGVTAAQGDAPAAAHLVLETRDGLGRFLQVAARVRVAVTLAPVTGEPRVLGRREWSPAELRAAYRSGLMGTHYTLDVPLDLPAGTPAGTPLAVTVELVEGWSGQEFRAAGTLRVP